MDIEEMWRFKNKLSKYNTHIVDKKICLGGVTEDNPIGIGFHRDFENILWAIPFDKAHRIVKINEDVINGKGKRYQIYFSNNKEMEILAYNRDVCLVPFNIENPKEEDIVSLLTQVLFDDNLSYFKLDNLSVAVVGLDLFKFNLNEKQKRIINSIIKDIEVPSIIIHNDETNTLCCIVDTRDFSFHLEKMNVETLKTTRLKSSCIHNNSEVKKYVENMISQYQLTKERTILIKELCEITTTK